MGKRKLEGEKEEREEKARMAKRRTRDLYVLCVSGIGFALVLAPGLGTVCDMSEIFDSVRFTEDSRKFKRFAKVISFDRFLSIEAAINQLKSFSQGFVTEELQKFVEINIPSGKESRFNLGVETPKVASKISQVTKIECVSNQFVHDFLRGVWLHFDELFKDLQPGDLLRAQLGLEERYQTVGKLNAYKDDEYMVIQAVSILDTLDKDISSLSVRLRECYSSHFPELLEIIKDNCVFAKLANLIEDKSKLSAENLLAISDIVEEFNTIRDFVKDENKPQDIVEAVKASMGENWSPVDLINLQLFAQRIMKLCEYREKLCKYLISKMNDLAPNLSSLIGEVVGARLIFLAGSLKKLTLFSVSKIESLGATQASLRINRRRFGLISRSSVVGRAFQNRDRIIRALAHKCAAACRVDYFLGDKAYGKILLQEILKKFEGDFERKVDLPMCREDSLTLIDFVDQIQATAREALEEIVEVRVDSAEAWRRFEVCLSISPDFRPHTIILTRVLQSNDYAAACEISSSTEHKGLSFLWEGY